MRAFLGSCVVLLAGCAPDLSFGDELIDFGESIAGVEHVREISVFSRLAAPLRLNGAVSSNPNFSLSFPAELTLEPRGRETLRLQYAPRVGTTEPEEASIELWAGNGVLTKLRARGIPVKPKCTVPAELDFGGVATNEMPVKLLEVENELPEATFAIVEHVSGVGFALPSGTLDVERGETLQLPVQFTPFDFREFEGTMSIRMSHLCEPKLVRLRGTGFPSVLVTDTEFVDWRIPLGTTEVKQVTLLNHGFAPVRLSDFEVREGTLPSSVFRITRSPLSIAAAERSGDQLIPGIATMELSFTAESTSVHQATVTIATDLSSHPRMVFILGGRVAP